MKATSPQHPPIKAKHHPFNLQKKKLVITKCQVTYLANQPPVVAHICMNHRCDDLLSHIDLFLITQRCQHIRIRVCTHQPIQTSHMVVLQYTCIIVHYR